MDSNYEEIVKSMRDKALEFDAALCKAKKTNDELVVKSQKALQSITELLGTVNSSSAKKNMHGLLHPRRRARAFAVWAHFLPQLCRARRTNPVSLLQNPRRQHDENLYLKRRQTLTKKVRVV